MRNIILTIVILHLCFITGKARTEENFASIDLPTGSTTSVFSIVQTQPGFIWLGTDDGLLRYDGYTYKSYRWTMDDIHSLSNNIVNALTYDSSRDILYVGTDIGACIYNQDKDNFESISGAFGKHVKAFLIKDDILYICTTTELLEYKNGTTKTVLTGHFTNIRQIGLDIWATTYNTVYQIRDENIIRHDLSSHLTSRNTLVLDICQDNSDKDALWIGSENGLMHYYPKKRKIDKIEFTNTPVKTFNYIKDELWIGSDDGLIIYHNGKYQTTYKHMAGRELSLPNNVVWSILEDYSGDVWIGTDHGVTISDKSSGHRFVGIEDITGKKDGQDISVIEMDNEGQIWLGGHDGLIYCSSNLNSAMWFKSDSKRPDERLSHNKVRDLYDDGEVMWIVSDGGLDAYVHKTGKIIKCKITEPTGKFSSNWMYSIAEDSDGRLWIGTYDGGLFAIQKERLLNGKGEVIADMHLSVESTPSLTSNIVRHVAINGDTLYAESYNTINIISLTTWETTRINIPHDTFVVSMLTIENDIFIGTDKGIFYLNDNNELVKINELDIYALSMAYNDGLLWVAGKSTISSYDINTKEWNYYPIQGKSLMSICPYEKGVYVGTVDGVIVYSPMDSDKHSKRQPITLTGLYINDEIIQAGNIYDNIQILEENIISADKITLSHLQNSFTFTMSEFSYGKFDKTMHYRLKGFDDKWRKVQEGSNAASFINVPSGKYQFEYCYFDALENTEGHFAAIDVVIKPAWYMTTYAYLVYSLVFIGLLVAGFYYWKMKHMLAMEHAERERAIAMADSKTEFLANIAHDFKSPLSIILGYISKMSASESDSLKSNELQAVQRNAEKIHILLNQIVEFNENDSSCLFIPTATSLVDLTKDVWSSFNQAFIDKQISARFVSEDIDYIFMVDKLQIESAIQNLLSNSLKFTPTGGSILMSVAISEETTDMIYVDIKVEDSGCGISESELTKIFNRYYMAPSGQIYNLGGSGLGLNIVKTIVERHKGKIWAESELGKGSCFTIRLSTLKADSFILKSAGDTEESLHNLSQVWQHERKPIILVVEDNDDIRDFIVASLNKDYVFITADNGLSALEKLKSEKIDLVITDINMPEMDGLTMSRTIRNNLETAFLPIIALTGKNDANTQMQSYEYVDAFITKPFDLNYLNGRIIKLLIKHEQYLSKLRQQKMLLPQTEELESLDEKFLSEIIRITNKHIADSEFSVAALCKESHWPDKQVYRKIKQLTGKTISEFIREIRLEKAAAYFNQGKLTINEVMYKVGFTTASYFSKCFKEKYGVTPKEYLINKNNTSL